MALVAPKDDSKVKEVLNLTNDIRVNIEDIVRKGRLEYRNPKVITRVIRSPPKVVTKVVPLRIPVPVRVKSIRDDPYDVRGLINPHSERKARVIDVLRERE